jgi:hypothetical protein
MDASTVYQLFVSTYHPDPNVHKQAELNIRGVGFRVVLEYHHPATDDNSKFRLKVPMVSYR